MSMLERWLPFKFRRKNAEEKKAEGRSTGLQTRTTGRPESQWPMLPGGPWMRDVFEDPFFLEPFGRFGEVDRWFGDFAPSRFAPRVDVTDEDRCLKVTAELPGMSKDDLELTVDNGVLTIRGEKRHEEQSTERGVYRTERYYGYLDRSLPLPEDVDQENAEAEFDKGVLTVRFPKISAKEPRGTRVAIKG